MLRHRISIDSTSPSHCHILVIYFVFCFRERRFQRLFYATLDRWKLSQFTHLPRPPLLSHPQYLAQLFVYLTALLAWKLIPIISLNSATIHNISRGFHRLPTTVPLFPCLFFVFPSIFAFILLPHFIWNQSPLPHPYLLLNPSYLAQIIEIIFITSRLPNSIPLFELISHYLTLFYINPHYLTYVFNYILGTAPKLSTSFLLPHA